METRKMNEKVTDKEKKALTMAIRTAREYTDEKRRVLGRIDNDAKKVFGKDTLKLIRKIEDNTDLAEDALRRLDLLWEEEE